MIRNMVAGGALVGIVENQVEDTLKLWHMHMGSHEGEGSSRIAWQEAAQRRQVVQVGFLQVLHHRKQCKVRTTVIQQD